MPRAEFLPADPAAWFDAALDVELRFARYDNPCCPPSRLLFDYEQKTAAQNFLMGWLTGTRGGEEALAAWMDSRTDARNGAPGHPNSAPFHDDTILRLNDDCH